MIKKCKKCNKNKVAEYSHLGKNGAGIYKDEKGRLWKGDVCNDCQTENRKGQRKNATSESKETKT